MKLARIKFFFYILLLALTPTVFCVAKEDAELEIQFAKNTNLQAFLDKKINLIHQEESFLFETKEFVNWKTNFTFEEKHFPEIENSETCEVALALEETEVESLKEVTPVCNLTRSLNSTGNLKKGALLQIDQKKIEDFISELSEEVVSAPKNAKLKMVFEENTDQEQPETRKGNLEIIKPGENGIALNEEKTLEAVLLTLKSPSKELELQLPVQETKPKISKETLEELKIDTQIGHGESNFAGSPKNRIHNIYVAVERFDGLLLAPGEEFSFTTILGPVDKETGYKEELVIKENKTIPEYGGGVCQVSTTVFRAALNTGLKITERRNHAYPVQYYSPQGTDATIYIPKPDLRFINNTPSYILFQASIEGRKLTFDIFGESDGRVVEMEGPKVTERTPEGILKVRLKQIVKDKEGNIILEDTFKSVYDNPDKYHEPEILKQKPENWSNKQWKAYKKEHNL